MWFLENLFVQKLCCGGRVTHEYFRNLQGLMLHIGVFVCDPYKGHFNPAVTLGLCFNTAITVTRAILYWIAQLVGAIVGAAMARAML